jgi:hypothetical protein
MIFTEKWAFNRAGKTVSKIGIYALPPLKREIYRGFINSRPNFVFMAQQFMIVCMLGIVLSPFSEKRLYAENEFFLNSCFLWVVLFASWSLILLCRQRKHPIRFRQKPLKQGTLQAQAIVHYPISSIWL